MERLVQIAQAKLGPLQSGFRYCLTIPGPLGGEYAESNIQTVPFEELIGFSGEVARQIKDIPEGARIQFKFT